VNELYASIGRRIRAALTARGLTQAALADAVAVEAPTIRDLKAGRCGPSTETLLSLARALDRNEGVLLDAAPSATGDDEAARIVSSLSPSWRAFALRTLRDLKRLKASPSSPPGSTRRHRPT
jgi:transcriptional regulator with XRE-family HTH domain